MIYTMAYRDGFQEYGQVSYIVLNCILCILNILNLNISQYDLQIWM